MTRLQKKPSDVHRLRGGVRLLAAVAVAVGMTGCGNDGTAVPADAVATIDGTTITSLQYDQRERLETLTATVTATGVPVLSQASPALVRFDGPPQQCVADIRRIAKSAGASAPAAAAVLEVDDRKLADYCRSTATQIEQRTVTGLLADRVTIAEAEKRGISAPAKPVDEQTQNLVGSLGGASTVQDIPASVGVTLDQIRERARVNVLERLLYGYIAEHDGQVTDAERRKFYAEHPERFDQSERRDLLVIEVSTRKEAEAARRELEAGTPFATVAGERSIHQRSKADGGKLDFVAQAGIGRYLGKRPFNASAGELVGPFRGKQSDGSTGSSYYLVQVQKVYPRGPKPFEKLRDALTDLLSYDKAQKAIGVWQARTRDEWRPKIECHGGYVVADLCGNKKLTPVTPATTTTTASKPPTR